MSLKDFFRIGGTHSSAAGRSGSAIGTGADAARARGLTGWPITGSDSNTAIGGSEIGGDTTGAIAGQPDSPTVFVMGANAAQAKGLGEMLNAGIGVTYPGVAAGQEDGPRVFIVGADAGQVKGVAEMLAPGAATAIGGQYIKMIDINLLGGQQGSPNIFIAGADAAQVKGLGDMLAAGTGTAMAIDDHYTSLMAGHGSNHNVVIIGADAAQVKGLVHAVKGIGLTGSTDTSIAVDRQTRPAANALFDYFDNTLESDYYRALLDKVR